MILLNLFTDYSGFREFSQVKGIEDSISLQKEFYSFLNADAQFGDLMDKISEKINNGKSYYYSTKKFYLFGSSSPAYQIYDYLQFTLKDGDKKYIIYGMSGKLLYENNFKDCLKKKDEIVKEVTDLLGNNTKIQDRGTVNHTYDKSGKSKATTVDFFLNSGGGISVYCTDWSEEMGFYDNLKVFASSKELDDYFEMVK